MIACRLGAEVSSDCASAHGRLFTPEEWKLQPSEKQGFSMSQWGVIEKDVAVMHGLKLYRL